MILVLVGLLLSMIPGVLSESSNHKKMSENKLEKMHCYSFGRTNVEEEKKWSI